MKKLLTLVLVCVALMACKDTKNSKILGDQQAGESLTGWYYYHVMRNQLDSIPNLLDANSFTTAQQTQLINAIKDRQESSGAIKSFVLKDWEQTDSNKKEKTKDFIFQYEVKYENKSTLEKIYLEKKGNTLKISKIEFE
ncbi:hypothetical protein [Myroides sp. LJL119]